LPDAGDGDAGAAELRTQQRPAKRQLRPFLRLTRAGIEALRYRCVLVGRKLACYALEHCKWTPHAGG
jgi:hypothetical protein